MESKDLIIHNYFDELQQIWYLMERQSRAFARILLPAEDPTYLIFSELSVSPYAREKGIGEFLLQYCIEFAKEKKLKAVWLWVEKDSWMQGWYQRRGFVLQKEKEDQPGSIWMYKNLNPD